MADCALRLVKETCATAGGDEHPVLLEKLVADAAFDGSDHASESGFIGPEDGGCLAGGGVPGGCGHAPTVDGETPQAAAISISVLPGCISVARRSRVSARTAPCCLAVNFLPVAGDRQGPQRRPASQRGAAYLAQRDTPLTWAGVLAARFPAYSPRDAAVESLPGRGGRRPAARHRPSAELAATSANTIARRSSR
jgi:hypothetical protein